MLDIREIQLLERKSGNAGVYKCNVHEQEGIQICLEEGCFEILCLECNKTHNGTHRSNFMLCSQIEQRLIKRNKTLTSIEFLKETLEKDLIKKVEKNNNLSEKTLKETLTGIKQQINAYLDKLLQEQLEKQKKSTVDLKSKIHNCVKQLNVEQENLVKQLKKFKDAKDKSLAIQNILKQESLINSQRLRKIQKEFDLISEQSKSNQELKKFAQNQKQHIDSITNQFKFEIQTILNKMSNTVEDF